MHKIVSVTPVMATAGGYSSGDVVGVPIETSEIVTSDSGQALLKSLTVIDKAAQSLALDVWFFDSEPTLTNGDNGAFSAADAQLAKALGHVKVVAGDYSDGDAADVACVRNIDLLLQPAAGKRTLWLAVVARSTPTYASGDLVLKLGVEQL